MPGAHANPVRQAGGRQRAHGNWEAHKGKVNLRMAAAGNLQNIRGMGKKQAAQIAGVGKIKENSQ